MLPCGAWGHLGELGCPSESTADEVAEGRQVPRGSGPPCAPTIHHRIIFCILLWLRLLWLDLVLLRGSRCRIRERGRPPLGAISISTAAGATVKGRQQRRRGCGMAGAAAAPGALPLDSFLAAFAAEPAAGGGGSVRYGGGGRRGSSRAIGAAAAAGPSESDDQKFPSSSSATRLNAGSGESEHRLCVICLEGEPPAMIDMPCRCGAITSSSHLLVWFLYRRLLSYSSAAATASAAPAQQLRRRPEKVVSSC